MRIRPAAPADEAFILKLTEQLAAFPLPPWRTPAEVAAADHILLLDALHAPAPETSLLIAEDLQGTAVGFICSTTREDYFTHERRAHIEALVVDPAAQGGGVGQELMRATEAWCRERGYRRITLNVFDRNTRAREFYQRLGYTPETVHYLKEL